jgi:LytR cell envelope-related transcriptional attenuator
MSGAPIRAAIVVTAIVAGALVITLGFPAGGTISVPPPSRTGSPTSTPTPSSSATRKTATPTPAGRVEGVVVAVFNTTDVVGLAACAATDLSKLGYVVPAENLENAPPGSSTAETNIFYRNDQGRADAKLLAHDYFKDKDVKVGRLQAGADVPKGAELTIFLGTQYAATHQGGC